MKYLVLFGLAALTCIVEGRPSKRTLYNGKVTCTFDLPCDIRYMDATVDSTNYFKITEVLTSQFRASRANPTSYGLYTVTPTTAGQVSVDFKIEYQGPGLPQYTCTLGNYICAQSVSARKNTLRKFFSSLY